MLVDHEDEVVERLKLVVLENGSLPLRKHIARSPTGPKAFVVRIEVHTAGRGHRSHHRTGGIAGANLRKTADLYQALTDLLR